MKVLQPVQTTIPTMIPTRLPLHEHNARRRRGTVPTPSKDNQPHSAPHPPDTRASADAQSLLSTYSQFSRQGALHE